MNNSMPMGGGGMPMMNNGLPRQRAMPINDNQQRSQLNTYIYEYFLRNEMWDCARTIIKSGQPINVMKSSPSGRDMNGNLLENGDDGQEDSKDDLNPNKPSDLPAPNLPKDCPESCFLYEWWCLFWDMFNAQRGKGEAPNVQQYINHTQQQSRAKQDHQQTLLRQMRPGDMNPQLQMLMRNPQQQTLATSELARKAMQNNGQRNVQGNAQQMQHQQQMLLAQQQQAAQKQQFARDSADGANQQRPGSPKGENAPSPSKRPRLDGAPFTNGQQQPVMMPNGRGMPQGMPDQQQLQNFQNANMQGGPAGKSQSLQAYNSNLAQHQAKQMPNGSVANPAGPQNQGSPMMSQGQDGNAIGAYYNADSSMGNMQRPGVPGQPGGAGNHALQDYQMQLMLLEQQNKKRLMMARQEQDSLGPREGGIGPNGQPFQDGSPSGPRSGPSPNPNDMKRGTPQMGNTGISSPLPDGQSRGSPGSMGFMAGNQMDPNGLQKFYGGPMGGMEGQMVGMPGVARPPSSHPSGGFNGQMNPQMMQNMQRAAQQQQLAGGQMPGWQNGPNGAPMMQQSSQGSQPQGMGTPQQRAMPPPSVPSGAGTAPNGRTQPSSPQQNAAPPTPSQSKKAKPQAKDNKAAKKNTKKGANATPAGDNATEPATPTPATPVTPQVNNKSFSGNSGQTNPQNNNGQVGQQGPAPVLVQQQPDPNQGMSFEPDMYAMQNISMDFANPAMGSGDVLQDFDFDSFLHQDDGADAFAFDSGFNLEGGEIGAE